jgi:hypothetical protein
MNPSGAKALSAPRRLASSRSGTEGSGGRRGPAQKKKRKKKGNEQGGKRSPHSEGEGLDSVSPRCTLAFPASSFAKFESAGSRRDEEFAFSLLMNIRKALGLFSECL